MVGAYILVSLTIWVAACFSPEEWREAELCNTCFYREYFHLFTDNFENCSPNEISHNSNLNQHSDNCLWQGPLQSKMKEFHGEKRLDVLENEFSIGNSFWFTIGSLMQQGSDLSPKVSKIIKKPQIITTNKPRCRHSSYINFTPLIFFGICKNYFDKSCSILLISKVFY